MISTVDKDSDPVTYQSRNHNLPSLLVMTIIKEVSNQNTYLIKGDRYGLLQVPMEEARKFGFQGYFELLDPITNLEIGCSWLRALKDIHYKEIGNWKDFFEAAYPEHASNLQLLWEMQAKNLFEQ